MRPSDAYEELIRRSREAAVLGSCAGVLGWDERTYLPRNGSSLRGDQMALLARMCHEMNTSPRIGECPPPLRAATSLPTPQAMPRQTLEKSAELTIARLSFPNGSSRSLPVPPPAPSRAWQEARQADDFPAFQPWLEKIIALKREEAQAIGYKEHPYDALLDQYEPAATASSIRTLFQALAAELSPFIAAVQQSSRKPKRELLEREFPVEAQKAFGTEAATAIGFSFESGRLDTTAHPFCSGIGPGDCRITTRYNPRFFNESFFGILHEAGHGIYEQGLDPKHYGTPLGSACSLGIHESQSRLWENQVGRSRSFWDHFFPKAQAAFPAALDTASLDDFFFAINTVRPSLIRVEADEATYNLHIIMRFELELALLTGDLKPSDVPGAWSDRSFALLGLRPDNNRTGCLQDIHWSMGGIGYFPTYTLGNLYAAQFMAQARLDLPGLERDFRGGEFARLKGWLNEKIHYHGMRYPAAELCQRITGKAPDHAPLLTHLREKFIPLYGL